MVTLNRITFPITSLRKKGVPDGNGGTLWVVTGPSTHIADAIAAGGCHIMTGKGPRTILVDRVVKLADGTLALVEPELDFDAVKNPAKAAAITDVSDEALMAEYERRRAVAAATAKPVTSGGKTNGNRGRKATTNKPAEVVETEVETLPTAAAAVADVGDDDLSDLMVTS